MCVCFLSRHLHAFLRRPCGFSRALGCGARGGPACTPRRKFGSRVDSVARALGVQSREIRQVITGSLSAKLGPSKTTENPHVRCFAPLLLSSLLCGNHSTTAVAHQVCVDACVDIAYACLCCVFAMIRVRERRCVRVCIFVCWNPTSQFFVFFALCLLLLLLLLLLPCHVVPSLNISSSLLCGRHGTTAVTQQVCVDRYLLCVC